MIVLAHLCNGHTYAQLATGSVLESPPQPHRRGGAGPGGPAPALAEAARAASLKACVLLDGTLLPIDRALPTGPSTRALVEQTVANLVPAAHAQTPLFAHSDHGPGPGRPLRAFLPAQAEDGKRSLTVGPQALMTPDEFLVVGKTRSGLLVRRRSADANRTRLPVMPSRFQAVTPPKPPAAAGRPPRTAAVRLLRPYPPRSTMGPACSCGNHHPPRRQVRGLRSPPLHHWSGSRRSDDRHPRRWRERPAVSQKATQRIAKPSVLFVCVHNADAPRWPPPISCTWPATGSNWAPQGSYPPTRSIQRWARQRWMVEAHSSASPWGMRGGGAGGRAGGRPDRSSEAAARWRGHAAARRIPCSI